MISFLDMAEKSECCRCLDSAIVLFLSGHSPDRDRIVAGHVNVIFNICIQWEESSVISINYFA